MYSDVILNECVCVRAIDCCVFVCCVLFINGLNYFGCLLFRDGVFGWI